MTAKLRESLARRLKLSAADLDDLLQLLNTRLAPALTEEISAGLGEKP